MLQYLQNVKKIYKYWKKDCIIDNTYYFGPEIGLVLHWNSEKKSFMFYFSHFYTYTHKKFHVPL